MTLATGPDRCDLCCASLTRPDDAEYFGEPHYKIRVLPAGELEHGRPWIVTCPICQRTSNASRRENQ